MLLPGTGGFHMRLFPATQELSSRIDAIERSQAVIEFEMDGTIVTANANFLNALGDRKSVV